VSAEYVAGLATLPIIAAVGWALYFIGSKARDWWTDYGPGFNQDETNLHWRSGVAAAIVLARRFLMIRLPGGLVIAYRSNGPSSVKHGLAAARDDALTLRSDICEAVRKIERNSR